MVWELVDRGEEVVVIDRLSTGFDWAVAPFAELVVGDVADQLLVRETIQRRDVDAIIHFAGSVVVPDSVSDPLSYYLNNTVNSRSLIDSAVRSGVKNFIFSSTAAVYGTPAVNPVTEDVSLRPESPYGTSKLMTELMLRDTAAAHDFTYAALRYFNVAGADPQQRTGQSTRGATHLIKAACEAATGRRPYLEIFGTDYTTADGTCVRDYIHVSDLVAAHYAALARLRAGNGSLTANCGYGRGYSVREVIDAVKHVSGIEFDVRDTGRRAGDAVAVVADTTRCRAELDWRPKYDDLEQIVGDALRWEERLRGRNPQ